MDSLYGSGKPYRVIVAPPIPDIRVEVKDLYTREVYIAPLLRQLMFPQNKH